MRTKLSKEMKDGLEYWSQQSKVEFQRTANQVEPDEPVEEHKRYAIGGRVQPKRVITLKESDYAQLQSLVLKYGSGTGHGTSLSIDARVAIADANYDWSKDEE